MDHVAAKRIAAIKRRIDRVELICTGTLLERTKTCGKSNCRCATDPVHRHGPYFEWNRLEQGKLRHRAVSAEEAKRIRRAKKNYQRLVELLVKWERESFRAVLGPGRLKPRKQGR